MLSCCATKNTASTEKSAAAFQKNIKTVHCALPIIAALFGSNFVWCDSLLTGCGQTCPVLFHDGWKMSLVVCKDKDSIFTILQFTFHAFKIKLGNFSEDRTESLWGLVSRPTCVVLLTFHQPGSSFPCTAAGQGGKYFHKVIYTIKLFVTGGFNIVTQNVIFSCAATL